MAFEFELPNPNTQNPKVDLSEADLVRRSASSVPAPARQLAPVANRFAIIARPRAHDSLHT